MAEMRKAGLLVWQAHQLAAAMVRPGVTTAEIDAVIDRFFAEQHAVPLFKGVPGTVPFPATTCISINEEVVHGIPSSRKLVEGDIVSIDTGCKLNGWCGDAAATYAVGRIAPDVRRLLDVTRNTLGPGHRADGPLFALEPGGRRDGGLRQETQVLGRRGVRRPRHRPRHARRPAGAELRQPPAPPRHGRFRLVPGLVIAVEPMVNMGTKRVRTRSDHWTQVTADGRPSAHFEHTVAITENGPWVLTAGPNGETW